MKTLLAILFSCLTLNATTYYVDYSSGDDSLAGTSTATAWKHAPGDPNGTGVSGSATLSAGDTVIYKGGVSYYGQTTLMWSGTSGNPITYDGNSSGVWGVGKAIMDGGEGVYNNCFPAFSTKSGSSDAKRNYLTFTNLVIQNYGGYASNSPTLLLDCTSPITSPISGSGIYLGRGGAAVNIGKCDFLRIGQWRNQPPFSGVNSITGLGVRLSGCTDSSIVECTATKMKTGLALSVDASSGGVLSGITVKSNVIGPDLVWGIDVSSDVDNMVISNVNLEANIIFNTASYDNGNWLGCGEAPHSDGIFFRTGGKTNVIWTNVVAQANWLYCDQPADSTGGTAGIYISQGPSVRIFNNNFFCEPRGNGQLAVGHNNAGIDQLVEIYNNTFIGGGWNCIQVVVNTSTIWTRTTRIYNNVFVSGSTDSLPIINVSTNAFSVVDSDYNIYFKPGFTSSTYVFNYDDDGDGSYTSKGTLANHQARGFDTHSIYADPQFITGTDFSTPSLINARLSSQSPAIGAGTNLSVYGVTTDFTGATRSLPFDIGAYQFTATEQGGDGGSTGGSGATGSSFTSGSVTIRGGVILR